MNLPMRVVFPGLFSKGVRIPLYPEMSAMHHLHNCHLLRGSMVWQRTLSKMSAFQTAENCENCIATPPKVTSSPRQSVSAVTLYTMAHHAVAVLIHSKDVIIGIITFPFEINLTLRHGEHTEESVGDLAIFACEGAIFKDRHPLHPQWVILRCRLPPPDDFLGKGTNHHQKLWNFSFNPYSQVSQAFDVIFRLKGLGS